MPGTQITPGLDQINNAFGQVYGMIGGYQPGGSSLTGGAPNAFGMPPQPISGADNSLTAAQRGASNIAGVMAPMAFNMGQGMLGTGMGVAQTGLGAIQPSVDFYTKLLSGDPTTMSGALGPLAGPLASWAAQAQNATRAMPSGGLASAEQGNIATMIPQVLGQGAEQLLSSAAGSLGNLGLGEAGVGTQIGQMGTTMTGQGLQGILNLYSDLINKQSVNQQDTPFTTFGQVMGPLATLGAGIAGAVSGGKGGCWIAEAIYGKEDARTHLVRAYLNGPFARTLFGRVVMWLYGRFGQRIAAAVRCHGWLRKLFRPVFDRALQSAWRWAASSAI